MPSKSTKKSKKLEFVPSKTQSFFNESMGLTVGQLRELLSKIPDHLPVTIVAEDSSHLAFGDLLEPDYEIWF